MSLRLLYLGEQVKQCAVVFNFFLICQLYCILIDSFTRPLHNNGIKFYHAEYLTMGLTG